MTVVHRGRWQKSPGRRDGLGQRGSVLLFVLFACLLMAVVVQTLTVVILCAEGARWDEQIGRMRLREKDTTLARLRQEVLEEWKAVPSTWWPSTDDGGAETQGEASLIPGSEEWLMLATARQAPSVSRSGVSVVLEQGRDGIDLPLAAVVAGCLSADPARELTWVEVEIADDGSGGEFLDEADSALCYAHELSGEPVFGAGCVLATLDTRWRLDDGWLDLASGTPTSAEPLQIDVALGSNVIWLDGSGAATSTRSGNVSSWDDLETSPQSPALVVATGGVDLDACDLGDVYGVIVVDEGSLELDGTVLHGAAIVSDELSLGTSGQVVYSPATLRWATDRSLRRVRLVPGTRWEAVD